MRPADNPLGLYILEGHEPVPCATVYEWANWFEKMANRRVAETRLAPDCFVSTIFLGIDHSFMGGRPLLFETMIFGGPVDDYQERYATWEEAEQGHLEAVRLAAEGRWR